MRRGHLAVLGAAVAAVVACSPFGSGDDTTTEDAGTPNEKTGSSTSSSGGTSSSSGNVDAGPVFNPTTPSTITCGSITLTEAQLQDPALSSCPTLDSERSYVGTELVAGKATYAITLTHGTALCGTGSANLTFEPMAADCFAVFVHSDDGTAGFAVADTTTGTDFAQTPSSGEQALAVTKNESDVILVSVQSTGAWEIVVR